MADDEKTSPEGLAVLRAVDAELRIERFARRVALGNNGGEWATHYTEDQKEHWRQFVRDLIADLKA